MMMLTALTLSALIQEQAKPPQDADVKKLRELVIKAKTADDKAGAYKDLFKHLGRARFSELENDEDVGIALQASWERNRVIRSDAKIEALGNLDRESGQKFLGLV